MTVTMTAHLMAGGGVHLLLNAIHTAEHGCLAFEVACDEASDAAVGLALRSIVSGEVSL